jgi:hypothetical protein
MLRHEYVDHVAALCVAAAFGRDTRSDGPAVASVALAYANALADLRYPEAADAASDANRVRQIAMALSDSEPATAAELAALATRLGATAGRACGADRASPGWVCSRERWHDGPCAARPIPGVR